MFRKPLFLETFVLLTIVGVTNYIAVDRHLYWTIYEFDSVVHFLAGATLSLFFLWLYFFSGWFKPSQRRLTNFLIVSILGSMFVAVFWESYELILGEALLEKNEYFYDTTLDFIMDLLGILAACFYGFLKEGKNIQLSGDIKNEQS